ncbi:MAG TPA: hypothetical protein DC038_05430, partial [Clostridiales bacterium]|nr:hypothetical protein [Clostridiales bacterium]
MAKRKNFGLKNFFFSFAAVCIVIYIFQNLNGSVESMVAENGNLENVIIADGIVVKDERVYNASVNGSATYYYEDGAKIKSGQLVADLNTDMSAAQINQQMAEIQAAIDMKKSSDGTAAITAVSSETAAVYENEIQLSILNSELNSVYALAGQVSSPDAVTVHSD